MDHSDPNISEMLPDDSTFNGFSQPEIQQSEERATALAERDLASLEQSHASWSTLQLGDSTLLDLDNMPEGTADHDDLWTVRRNSQLLLYTVNIHNRNLLDSWVDLIHARCKLHKDTGNNGIIFKHILATDTDQPQTATVTVHRGTCVIHIHCLYSLCSRRWLP